MSLVGKFGGLCFGEVSLKFADKKFCQKVEDLKKLAFVEGKLTQDQVELDGIKGTLTDAGNCVLLLLDCDCDDSSRIFALQCCYIDPC